VYNAWPALFTASVEIGIAVWILRGTFEKALRMHLAAILFLLAGYQVLETVVCAMPQEGYLPRLAFAWIVWLPPAGIALLVRLAQPTSAWPRQASQVGLALAGVWSATLLAVPNTIQLSACETVFARYHSDVSPLYVAYGAFYDLGLAIIVFAGLRAVATCTDPLRRALLADFVTGNLAFILGALCVMVTMADSGGMSASVLCHFALALGVSIGVMGLRLSTAQETQPVRRLVVG